MKTVRIGNYVDDYGEATSIPAGTKIITPEEQAARNAAIQKRKEVEEARLNATAIKNDKCGNFFWSLYEVGQDYYPNVSDDMLAKIIYLLTYLDYKNGILVTRDNAFDAYRPMTKDDVKKVIRLHRCKFPRFWEELLQSGIIFENEKGQLAVSDLFRRGRGKLDKRTTKGMAAMKIFSHAIRYVYENTDVRSHRYLAYLYRLIPYINLKYNVLCLNPLETNKFLIQPLTTKELCELIGIESRRDNETRLINTLFKLSFYDKAKDKLSVITLIKRMKNDEVCQYITINPQFYAGYISVNDMADIMGEFVVHDKEELQLGTT